MPVPEEQQPNAQGEEDAGTESGQEPRGNGSRAMNRAGSFEGKVRKQSEGLDQPPNTFYHALENKVMQGSDLEAHLF